MLRAQQPSSPLAFYASTASAFPATGTSSSYTTDNNNAGDREACPSSPIASTSHTGSPLHVSSSRPKAASVLRRYQYKSRSPAAGSSSTTTVPSSSPLGRWHDQLLYNSAQRARQDRERSRSGTRGGLLLLEREHGPEGRDLSESEQMVVRRLWRREQERRQEQLELDWEDQQLGVINEQDLEELELDALRAAATAEGELERGRPSFWIELKGLALSYCVTQTLRKPYQKKSKRNWARASIGLHLAQKTTAAAVWTWMLLRPLQQHLRCHRLQQARSPCETLFCPVPVSAVTPALCRRKPPTSAAMGVGGASARKPCSQLKKRWTSIWWRKGSVASVSLAHNNKTDALCVSAVY